MLLDGCLYIYSELDPESSARGKEGNINSDSLFLEENTRYTISIPNAQDMCAWNLNKKTGCLLFYTCWSHWWKELLWSWRSGVIFLHGYRAQSGSVAGKRHSFEMVSVNIKLLCTHVHIVTLPSKKIGGGIKKVVLEILKKIWSPRYLQTPSWDTSISSPRQRRRRKGPD